jgi:rRNA maturation protein Nop10
LLIAPIEELSKLLAVWVAIYRSEDFREPIDGLLYSVTAALGFASIENILYTDLFGPRVLVLRALFATPAHIMYSAMWGYSMGLARFQRDRELLTILKGLLVAIVFHGTYNLLVAVYPQVAVVSLVPLMLFMAWLIHRRLQDFRRNYPFPPIGKGALILCPLCGAYTLEQEELCSRCGSRLPAVEVDAPRFCGKCRALLDPSRSACPRCGETVDLSRLRPPG